MIKTFKKLFLVIICLFSISVFSQNGKNNKMNLFVNNLMKKMTLDEKIGQLNLITGGEATTGSVVSSGVENKLKTGNIGGIFSLSSPKKIRKAQDLAMQSRLKIPVIFGMDVIHGYRTLFPIPLGVSCTWDMKLIENSARVAASEASADGICWTFSPMVDISRDARWGRISEGSGEDPFLGAEIAKAMVKGYQGNLSNNTNIMACVKHYALYGASEAGRDYNTVDMSHYKMYNDYFPPYKAAVDAGVGAVMASFNVVDGIPATANKWLLTDVLRKKWGFDGLLVTDYTGINEMTNHGLGDLQAVSAKALNAGIDMDMVGEGFLNTLKKSLKEGKVTQNEIDRACKKVLEIKYKLGLFENPYKFCNDNRAENEIFTAENRFEARKTAAKSFVLLKNDKNILPIAKKNKIALIGPLGDNKENMAGTWSVSGEFTKCVSLEEGIKNVAGNQVEIVKSRGANIYPTEYLENNVSIFGKPTYRDNRTESDLIADAIKVAENSDVIVAALGEAAEMTGESSSRSEIDLPQNQQKLLKALLATGKPVILVLFTGRPLTLSWEHENVPAILNVWFGGTEAGNAIADVLFGDVNPSGKLTTTFPRNIGQIPLYYNHLNTGRPASSDKYNKFQSNHFEVPNSPLYPFGYGLSYTNFEYSDVKFNKNKLKGNEKLQVSVLLKNTGKRSGSETVQLYIRDIVGSVSRPVKELKGFQNVQLEPNETKTVRFEIGINDLKFYNNELKYDWEPGEFEIMIGGSSENVKTAKVVWN